MNGRYFGVYDSKGFRTSIDLDAVIALQHVPEEEDHSRDVLQQRFFSEEKIRVVRRMSANLIVFFASGQTMKLRISGESMEVLFAAHRLRMEPPSAPEGSETLT